MGRSNIAVPSIYKEVHDLGLEEGILNRIESDSPDTKARLRQALGTFQSKLDPTEVNNRQLIQRVPSHIFRFWHMPEL